MQTFVIKKEDIDYKGSKHKDAQNQLVTLVSDFH